MGAAVHRKAKRFLKRFKLSRNGGVAMIFGLSFIPLSMLTLTAIDFHRASTVRNALQDALDAASLAAARSDSTNAATIQSIGYNTLVANMTSFPDASVTAATFVLEADGTVTGDASAQVSPLVSHMFIGGPIEVGADSEVVRANDKLEIALVLDNTGSMSGTKISTLRTAAANLVDDLTEAASKNPDPDAIKLALVPFSMTVRVGSGYSNASWLDRNGLASQHDDLFDTAGTLRFSMLTAMNLSWAGCVESRVSPYDVQETAPSAANPNTLFQPFFAPDEPDVTSISGWSSSYVVDNNYLPDGISTKSADYKKWFKHQGRKAKYKTAGLSLSNGKGPNRGCTMEPLARLTTNTNSIKASINNMVATGQTNIPMGLAWGWHVLSPLGPFADGAPYEDDEVTKVVILMTDGDNVNDDYDNPNDSLYQGVNYVWSQRLGLDVGSSGTQRSNVMDSRLATLCTNMKAKGIVIYTVRVEVSSGSSTLLQNCASEADNFYDVQNVADLGDAFEQIAGQISRLRIAH